MHQASTEKHRKFVAAVVAAADRLPRPLRSVLRGSASQPVLRAYYANVQAEDLAGRDPRELAVIALSHLAAARRPGRALVRVFNPTLREHGYSSPHTVVETVNDDMPFLVDSIGLALSQRTLTLHFLAHPVLSVTRDRGGAVQSGRGTRPIRRRQEAATRILSAHRSRPHRRSCGAAVAAVGNRKRACATCASCAPIG